MMECQKWLRAGTDDAAKLGALPPSLKLIHIEDDPDDAFLLQRALRRAVPHCQIQRFYDGEDAMEYLLRLGQVPNPSSQPLPDLIILDLKLPKITGLMVLEWVRTQAPLAALPIVVLSGSSLEIDQRQALKLGAIAYLVKSSNYTDIAVSLLRLVQLATAPPLQTGSAPTGKAGP